MPLDQNRPTLRSQRLSQITHAPHEQLDKAVKAHAPFDTLASYSRFVVAQYLFQKELQPLYSDPALQTIISDLPARCRAEQARADLADLNMDLPLPVAGAVQKPSSAEALGWLFVSEGSKLGAAFLIKRAQALNLSDSFGARHLGEPAGGRAAGWKAFVRTLDELPLTAEQEAELDRGAIAAFERFNVLLQYAYADAPVADMAQA
ncbi:biliverdin-producing heme oxygenase [Pseudomonas fragariae (ex Marin et al. 2024)]|uniref:Biliverdin-producing heme oxygenase n=1 Tax=Pseudomonas syringae UB303 TaxID=1357287 RepID=A0AAJ4B3L1_PSESX|nr:MULTISPECIES: biliverdin-producing heme oxygenase [Pseudomonas]MCA5971690.1 biliverdin-producing heme oxygenase [Pseudomonas sp. P135]MCH5533009.1 biliverdin-producing heme oxygenase [Pseudomonas syringae pv. syringae]MCH5570346.1 biliverdin-producing heme oxygenase [Pseudomonas syringae pv. syringae]PBP65758.1 biliverdin-producing heme oxygenase [Pseudomonas syringae]PPS42542.1 biliverdin-producing heme oxygenase [Pseudomonas syringae]